MVHAIERFSKVQNHGINLETGVQLFAPHMISEDQYNESDNEQLPFLTII